MNTPGSSSSLLHCGYVVQRHGTLLEFILRNSFDGIVSCLRTYSPAELRDLVRDLDGDEYEWIIGMRREPYRPFSVTYLIGYPKTARTDKEATNPPL